MHGAVPRAEFEERLAALEAGQRLMRHTLDAHGAMYEEALAGGREQEGVR